MTAVSQNIKEFIRYRKETNTYYATFGFDENFDAKKDAVKSAGFRFDGTSKEWRTQKIQVAVKLADYVVEEDRADLLAEWEVQKERIAQEEAERQARFNDPVFIRYNSDLDRYEAEFIFEDPNFNKKKSMVKNAGFTFEVHTKLWVTPNLSNAAKLPDHIDEVTKKHIKDMEKAVEMSRQSHADVDLPRPSGLDYLPYQKAGILYAMQHRNVVFGDEMGLGKTIQAIGVMNTMVERGESLDKVLIICPASLKLNWEREIKKWLVSKKSIYVVNGKGDKIGQAQITIINYDVMTSYIDEVRDISWDLIVADEAHYMKNPRAKRTVALFGGKIKKKKYAPVKAGRKLLLTGTPLPNRITEVFPIFNYLYPSKFDNFFTFAKRYANATHNGYGWDFSGHNESMMPELQERLRATGMVRRLKADVLTDLPAKVRQIVNLSEPKADKLLDRERQVAADHEEQISKFRADKIVAKLKNDQTMYRRAAQQLREAQQVMFEEMAKIRRKLGVLKVPHVVEQVNNVLEQGEKVIVFAHHKDVVNALMKSLGDLAVKVTGETPNADRQKAVDAFQNDDQVRVFVGNIRAAGVGLTLTEASYVLFAELDWTPANLTQAEDRAHRIGQENTVFVQHLVLDGSLDSKMVHTLLDKQDVIDKALDNIRQEERQNLSEQLDTDVEVALEEKIEIDLVEPTKRPSSPGKAGVRGNQEAYLVRERKGLDYDLIDQLAVQTISDECKDKVHEGIRLVASYCDGANNLDGMGFSKTDVNVGKALAANRDLTDRMTVFAAYLVRKYQRQISQEHLDAALEVLTLKEG